MASTRAMSFAASAATASSSAVTARMHLSRNAAKGVSCEASSGLYGCYRRAL
jgi:hypothetical protein